MPIVVAGQSYGGLAAAYAGLRRPERYGSIVSQSGSFWWPDLDRPCAGSTSVAVIQQVGRLETRQMRAASEWMRDALVDAHDVAYQVFEGGHEVLCRRGGLIDALIDLLGTSSAAR